MYVCVFVCALVRGYGRVPNKRIASQGMSILNREGNTENNEARYDERSRSLINIAELIGIQRSKEGEYGVYSHCCCTNVSCRDQPLVEK